MAFPLARRVRDRGVIRLAVGVGLRNAGRGIMGVLGESVLEKCVAVL